MTCDDGEHKEGVCVDGLHFDEPTGTCVWPHIAARENCKERAKVLEDGFSCPKDKKDQNGETVSHPHYAHPTNCEMFYVCLNGVEPRLLQCENLGEVFNDYTLVCDAPANVSGCEDWFDWNLGKKKLCALDWLIYSQPLINLTWQAFLFSLINKSFS